MRELTTIREGGVGAASVRSGCPAATLRPSLPVHLPLQHTGGSSMRDVHTELADLADPRHTAVLVVDVQTLFVGFPLHPPVEEVLPRLHRFIHAARAAGALIVRIENVIPDAMFSDVWQRQHGSPTLASVFGLVCESADVLAVWGAQQPLEGT